MPAASRMGLSRPSAAITSFVEIFVPSLRLTRAPVVRVNKLVVAVPERKSTFGKASNRSRSARLNSQFGKFQPKGWSEISAASKARLVSGATPSPPASTIRITCNGAACSSRWAQMPAASSTRRAGCSIAVERMSAPFAAPSVTGGVGSTQTTLKPAVPKAAAAVKPAMPPPEIKISHAIVMPVS